MDAFLTVRDRDREYLLVLTGSASTRRPSSSTARERHAGQSSYTFRRLLRVALDGLFFQTTVLLQLDRLPRLRRRARRRAARRSTTSCVYFSAGQPPPGYTSLAVLLLLLTGFVITSLGVVGLYVGRVFEQGKGRPLYIIDSYAGPEEQERRAAAVDADGGRALSPAQSRPASSSAVALERYYDRFLDEHGPTARGVDWNSPEAQLLRFEQLLKVHERRRPVLDQRLRLWLRGARRVPPRPRLRVRLHRLRPAPRLLEYARELHGDARRLRVRRPRGGLAAGRLHGRLWRLQSQARRRLRRLDRLRARDACTSSRAQHAGFRLQLF